MPTHRLSDESLAQARRLRREQTDAEASLWRLLRDRRLAGFKFRRQHPLAGYVLDFYCPELRLAVELDGGQHSLPQNREHNDRRSATLAQEHGVTVIRIWNHEILSQPEAVRQYLMSILGTSSPVLPNKMHTVPPAT